MKRILTAAAVIPFALLVTIYSPDWLFALVAGVLAALMLNEYLSLCAQRGRARPGSWLLIAGAVVAASFLGGWSWVVTTLVASTLCLLATAVFGGEIDSAMDRVAAGLSGLLYCSVLPG